LETADQELEFDARKKSVMTENKGLNKKAFIYPVSELKCPKRFGIVASFSKKL
jgi:hypothetical protein